MQMEHKITFMLIMLKNICCRFYANCFKRKPIVICCELYSSLEWLLVYKTSMYSEMIMRQKQYQNSLLIGKPIDKLKILPNFKSGRH